MKRAASGYRALPGVDNLCAWAEEAGQARYVAGSAEQRFNLPWWTWVYLPFAVATCPATVRRS
jgi:hypothetical protein